MIFQTALSGYRSHDILIWVMIIFAAIFAFFLLMEYVNNRKMHHLLWALSLITTFVAFHQVANTGTYTFLTESVGAGMVVLIPGLIATGLLLVTFEGKKLIGGIYFLCILIMTAGVTILGLQNIQAAILESLTANYRWFLLLLMLIPAVASTGIILAVPLYTMLTKKTSMKSIFMIIAGALTTGYAIWFVFMETVSVANYHLPWIFYGSFPYVFMLSIVGIVLGLLYEPEWKFTIPGVDLEGEGRVVKLNFMEIKSLRIIGPILGLAGGVLLTLTGMLAGFIFASTAEFVAATFALWIFLGILATLIAFAVLINWEWRLKDIGLYLLMGIGAVAIIFTAIIFISSSMGVNHLENIPAVFLTTEGESWIYVCLVFLWLAPILIILSGVLNKFILKE